MKNINYFEISKILVSTTHVLSRLRFQPKEGEIKSLLNSIGRFYTQNLNLWKYDEFLKLFVSFYQYDELIVVLNYLNQSIKQTDNINKIMDYAVLISVICEDACKLYDEKKYEQLSDLIDAIHGLPEALLYKGVWHEISYWKTYLGQYRKKWDKNYLKTEQKQIFKENYIVKEEYNV